MVFPRRRNRSRSFRGPRKGRRSVSRRRNANINHLVAQARLDRASYLAALRGNTRGRGNRFVGNRLPRVGRRRGRRNNSRARNSGTGNNSVGTYRVERTWKSNNAPIEHHQPSNIIGAIRISSDTERGRLLLEIPINPTACSSIGSNIDRRVTPLYKQASIWAQFRALGLNIKLAGTSGTNVAGGIMVIYCPDANYTPPPGADPITAYSQTGINLSGTSYGDFNFSLRGDQIRHVQKWLNRAPVLPEGDLNEVAAGKLVILCSSDFNNFSGTVTYNVHMASTWLFTNSLPFVTEALDEIYDPVSSGSSVIPTKTQTDGNDTSYTNWVSSSLTSDADDGHWVACIWHKWFNPDLPTVSEGNATFGDCFQVASDGTVTKTDIRTIEKKYFYFEQPFEVLFGEDLALQRCVVHYGVPNDSGKKLILADENGEVFLAHQSDKDSGTINWFCSASMTTWNLIDPTDTSTTRTVRRDLDNVVLAKNYTLDTKAKNGSSGTMSSSRPNQSSMQA